MKKSDTEKIFMSVVESNSVSYVAKQLNRHASAVYREIKQYEADFGVPLLYKKGIKLLPTETGRQLYEVLKNCYKEKQRIQSSITEKQIISSRTLIIGATSSIISTWLPSALGEFMKQSPHIALSLEEFNFKDYKNQEYDLIIGDKLPESNYESIHFVTHVMNLYASTAYLNQYDKPKKIEDLEEHVLLAYKVGANLPYNDINFHLTQAPYLKPKLFIGTGLGMVQSVDAGLGIGPISIDEGYNLCKSRVVPILPGIISSKVDIYINTLQEKLDDKLVKSFISYLIFVKKILFN